MRKAFLTLSILFSAASLFGASLCSGDPRPKSACAGWESLQQLRSLIPERLWAQDFAILIDKEAFDRAAPAWISQDRQDGVHQCRCALGRTTLFFLRTALSGENVRIDDRYQDFQWSPFWDNPPRIKELQALEEQIIKRNTHR